MSLTPRQEAFCRLYSENPNGAAAARDAGYAPSHAANQALRLLKQSAIADRVAALAADAIERRGAVADEREAAARDLAAQLQPVYAATLKDRDYDGVLQTVELQARIRGFAQGGSSIKARGPRPEGDSDERSSESVDEAVEAAARASEAVARLADDVRKLRLRQDRIEHVVTRMADHVDPNRTKDLLSWYYDELIADDAEEGYFTDDLAAASADEGAHGGPMQADANADKCR